MVKNQAFSFQQESHSFSPLTELEKSFSIRLWLNSPLSEFKMASHSISLISIHIPLTSHTPQDTEAKVKTFLSLMVSIIQDRARKAGTRLWFTCHLQSPQTELFLALSSIDRGDFADASLFCFGCCHAIQTEEDLETLGPGEPWPQQDQKHHKHLGGWKMRCGRHKSPQDPLRQGNLGKLG